jgi:hypothetical protein
MASPPKLIEVLPYFIVMTSTTQQRLASSLQRMAVAVRLGHQEVLLKEISFSNDLIYFMYPEVGRTWVKTEEILADARTLDVGD